MSKKTTTPESVSNNPLLKIVTKKFHLFITLLIVVVSIGFISITYKKNQPQISNNKNEFSQIYKNYQSNSIKNKLRPSPKQSEIPQYTSSQLSHARVDGILLVKFDDKILVAKENDEKIISTKDYPNYENIKWINDSFNFIKSDLINTSLQDAKSLPQNQGFIIVFSSRAQISHSPSVILDSRSVYYFHESGVSTTQYPILSFFSNDFYKGRTFPEVAEISKDGKIVAFDMYVCVDCDGHSPEKMLVKLETEDDYSRKTINLGEVEDFTFNDDNSFSYRQFPTECYSIDWQVDFNIFNSCVKKNQKPLITKSL